MPGNAVVSVGMSWGRPGTRTCGISVGPARGFRRLTQSAVQGLLALARGTDSRLGPSGWLGCPNRLISKVPAEILLAGCLLGRWRIPGAAG